MRQPQGTSAATLERPTDQAVTEEPTPAVPPVSEPPIPEPAVQVGEETGDAAPASESVSPADTVQAETPHPESEAESAPEPDQKPWGIPQPGPAPTAAAMTARGEALLSEGRLQEAIDQFTKAIALDPKHREAFERRAEAYTKQGRKERAEEDYRRIEALNAGA